MWAALPPRVPCAVSARAINRRAIIIAG